MPYRIHVLKVPTTIQGADWRRDHMFPYTHFADEGHDPVLYGALQRDGLVRFTCRDTFKLKPNRMEDPANRIDLYMPGAAALDIGLSLVELLGAGDLPALSRVDPEAARSGKQTLPVIRETREVRHCGVHVEMAGVVLGSPQGPVYVDDEAPTDGFVEMVGPEVHLGIPFLNVSGRRDPKLVRDVPIPVHELLTDHGEHNPFPKCDGVVSFWLQQGDARCLAQTLLRYAQGHGR